MKGKGYKEDSTRGKSVLNPVNYKGDALIQVWMDSRILATLLMWLDRQEQYPRFMSEVVRIPLQTLVEYLVEGGDVKMVEETGKARRMLESRFRIDLNKGKRGKKNVLHNQILSDSRRRIAVREGRETLPYEDSRIKGLVKIYEQQCKENPKPKESRDERLENDLRSAQEIGIIRDDTPLEGQGPSDEEFEEKERKIREMENAEVDLSQLNIVEE